MHRARAFVHDLTQVETACHATQRNPFVTRATALRNEESVEHSNGSGAERLWLREEKPEGAEEKERKPSQRRANKETKKQGEGGERRPPPTISSHQHQHQVVYPAQPAAKKLCLCGNNKEFRRVRRSLETPGRGGERETGSIPEREEGVRVGRISRSPIRRRRNFADSGHAGCGGGGGERDSGRSGSSGAGFEPRFKPRFAVSRARAARAGRRWARVDSVWVPVGGCCL
jgi:hypothetical protein